MAFTFAATVICAIVCFALYKRVGYGGDGILLAAILFVTFICVSVCQIMDVITCVTFPEKIILDALLSAGG